MLDKYNAWSCDVHKVWIKLVSELVQCCHTYLTSCLVSRVSWPNNTFQWKMFKLEELKATRGETPDDPNITVNSELLSFKNCWIYWSTENPEEWDTLIAFNVTTLRRRINTLISPAPSNQ